jgi:hypothetical protein
MKGTGGSRAVVTRTGEAVLLQWASETGAHGMPLPQDLEQMGWHRSAEHPLFQGTWLMETREAAPATVLPVARMRPRPRAARAR